MTLEDCYRNIGADYQGTVQRLFSGAFVERMVRKFLDDPSFQKLKEAMDKGEREEAFRAAHTLKGVSQNLGFTNLYEPGAELTQCLRKDMEPGAWELFKKTEEEYRKTTEAVRAFFDQGV